jgi:methylphosphotriester-DNA--protein-cysteine methyltransferase
VDRASSDQGDDLEEERKHGFRPCRRSRASRTGARAARA